MGTRPRAPTVPDGSTDYSHFTREEVSHALNGIDQYVRPRDMSNLLARYRELAISEPPASDPYERVPVTAADRQALAQELEGIGARSIAVPALVLINCVVFVAAAVDGAGVVHGDSDVLLRWGTNFGPFTLDGQWWRLFTAMFVHFGFFHLANNMVALWFLGRQTERLYGTVHFLLIYVFAGLCGNVASLLLNPRVDTAGASGAIFGIAGAAVAFLAHPRTRVPASIAADRNRTILIFIAYSLLNGFTHEGIDSAAHLGGLIGGLLLGWVLVRPLEPGARGQPLPRLARAALLGSAVLAAGLWPLMHPDELERADRDFQHRAERFQDLERKALADEAALGGQLARHEITAAEWSERLKNQIVPQWQNAEAVIRLPTLSDDSRLRDLQAALIHYIKGRQELITLWREGAGGVDDPARAERMKQFTAINAARGERAHEMLRELY